MEIEIKILAFEEEGYREREYKWCCLGKRVGGESEIVFVQHAMVGRWSHNLSFSSQKRSPGSFTGKGEWYLIASLPFHMHTKSILLAKIWLRSMVAPWSHNLCLLSPFLEKNFIESVSKRGKKRTFMQKVSLIHPAGLCVKFVCAVPRYRNVHFVVRNHDHGLSLLL